MGCLLSPPPIRLPGDDRRNVSTHVSPDGPVRRGRCSHCGGDFDSDIYRFRGVILCGECRYYVRHGRWPSHDRSPGGNFTSADEIIAAHEDAYHGKRPYTGE